MEKRIFPLGDGMFGAGTPKICVPVVAKDRDGIWSMAEKIAGLPVDLMEWRADCYEGVAEEAQVKKTLAGLRERLGKKALLFTFRTAGEGGERPFGKEEYYRLNRAVAATGDAQLMDVEAFLDEGRAKEEIGELKRAGCHVIASNHDFGKTPPLEAMLGRLHRMEALGADAAKLAVMPKSRQDVLRLLQATAMADEELSVPVVTMSMGKLGMISRICGSLTGSAMTFAAFGEGSAPGQLPVKLLPDLLNLLSIEG